MYSELEHAEESKRLCKRRNLSQKVFLPDSPTTYRASDQGLILDYETKLRTQSGKSRGSKSRWSSSLAESSQAIGYGGLIVAFGASIYYARKYIVERRRAQGANVATTRATGHCELFRFL